MKSKQLLKLIEMWLDEALRNQYEIQRETEAFPLPQWNKGYTAALEDLKGIINENDMQRM